MKLVIVESPAKAKTINKYLGKDFLVMASFGHIRDVPAKTGSIRPNEDFAMDWEVQSRGEKTVREMIKALAKADALYLASDPDREGEAIAWHVVQELKRRKKLPESLPIYRVVFHEITKNAILEAVQNPREIDMQLVDAYLARRALDYLVGFSISPLLWRSLPGAKSAGRVQSVALRLVCEREDEITAFIPQEYWSITTVLSTPLNETFSAKLTHIKGEKLSKFDLNNQTSAKEAEEIVKNAIFKVSSIERKQTKRNPAPSFTTSTLQQEASRKLGFSAKKTMQLAQNLYEGVDIGGETVGLITYMRTDSVALSTEAVTAIRSLIEKEYGIDYLPEKPRIYKNNSKNAQEAHEAIRPTNVMRTPQSIAAHLTPDQRKLYELIWKRTVASQMQSAVLDKVGIDILAADSSAQLRATGQTIAFAGFIKVYKEDVDDKNQDDDEKMLPPMNENDLLNIQDIQTEQHFTEAPPRFSEASLVKKLEELGIGRPSTYATILSVLQERAYVKLVAKKFIPEDRGKIVTAFLENYFTTYVQYDYTAQMENKLDEITQGALQWKNVLTDFWSTFDATVQAVPKKMTDILETVSKTLEKQLFPNEESRKCPDCENGKLSLHIGRFGAFIGCSNYPNCKHTKQFASITPPEVDENGKIIETTTDEKQSSILGKNAAGLDVSLKKGPYGWYVQLGEGKDAKRTSIPKSMNPETIGIEKALQLLSLPRVLGNDPETHEPIEAGLGKFGPYVKRGTTYQSLMPEDDILTIDFDRAIALLSQAKDKQKSVDIGKWQDDKITYQIGRYGPYVKWKKIMASVKQKDALPSLEEAIQLIQDKMHQK